MSVSDVVKRAKVEIETIEDIPDLKLIRPKVFPDERGFFSESYNIVEWSKQLGFSEVFKQVYYSFIISLFPIPFEVTKWKCTSRR